ncbi:MAG TPA: CarD family transcriptional regulator, partial [bacterium]|nr:CarD family transcriptional regulator [bacterium]
MYKVGNKIVCPLYGAGTVVEILKEKIDKANQEFVKIQLIHSNMELLIPVDMIEANGIRNISSDKQLSKALNILKKDPIKMEDDDMAKIINDLNSIIKSS